MKRSVLLIIMIVSLIQPAFVNGQAEIVDCTPENVGEWMIQRQVGRNKVQHVLEGRVRIIYLEELIRTQQVRRDLEDLSRPDCPEAEELYHLTIYLYDVLSDWFVLKYAQAIGFGDITDQDIAAVEARIQYYYDNLGPLYQALEEMAGIDVMAIAAEIQPVLTPVETTIAIAEDGTITAQGSGSHVFDPIDIPTGIYRMTFVAADFGSASIEGIGGTCSFADLTTDSNGSEEQTTFRSTDCRGIIEIQFTDEEWTLTLEPME